MDQDDAALESRARIALAGPETSTPTVDYSSFPLLLLHHLPHVETSVLTKSLNELSNQLKNEPANSPLLPYGNKQLKATRTELAKRSAAERVERLILGLETAPPLRTTPIVPAATTSTTLKRPRPRSSNNNSGSYHSTTTSSATRTLEQSVNNTPGSTTASLSLTPPPPLHLNQLHTSTASK